MKKILKRINFFFNKRRGIFYRKFKDQWYDYHQSNLRGSEEEIKERQKIYLPYIKSLSKKILGKSFLEIGFGRGEFLELLKQSKIQNIEGVDNNLLFFNQAKKKGFDVKYSDALEYLYLTSKTFKGISAFHFIEH